MKPVIDAAKFNVVRALEWVLVGVTVVQAAYIFSPIYQYSLAVNGATPFRVALADPIFLYIFIIGLLISAIVLAYGLRTNNDKFISVGLFGQTLLRFFNIAVTITAFGVLPISWLYPATIVCFCAVLWFHHKVQKVLENART